MRVSGGLGVAAVTKASVRCGCYNGRGGVTCIRSVPGGVLAWWGCDVSARPLVPVGAGLMGGEPHLAGHGVVGP